ncbi:MAG: FecR domain-containing protein [Chitinophagaceae bacterium]|nr:FecR domain-containing protein [Chitinophagaceae bacterium]
MLTRLDKKFLESALKRYESGQCSPAELHFIETWMDYQDKINKDIDPLEDLDAGARTALMEEMKLRLLEDIRHEEKVIELPPARKIRWLWRAAAVIVVLVGGTLAYRTFLNPKDAGQPSNITAHIQQDRPPGATQAVLKLAGGREIFLDSTKGKIAESDGQVINNEHGALHYDGKGTAAEYHTLATPRGGQYQLELPDGTRVWLNAASSITYPTVFTGEERKVTVRGEVYFEVAHNPARPFIVDVDGRSAVEVLGTSFDVNAYSDEPGIATTLLEGAISVAAGDKKQQLAPGQQALVTADGLQWRKDVNTREVVAWKEGLFRFENANIETIMRQLSRWYDVEVVYKGGKVKEYFNTTIPRNIHLSKVLELLELTGLIHFQMEDKKIVVTP